MYRLFWINIDLLRDGNWSFPSDTYSVKWMKEQYILVPVGWLTTPSYRYRDSLYKDELAVGSPYISSISSIGNHVPSNATSYVGTSASIIPHGAGNCLKDPTAPISTLRRPGHPYPHNRIQWEYNGLRGENTGPFKGQQASASNPAMREGRISGTLFQKTLLRYIQVRPQFTLGYGA